MLVDTPAIKLNVELRKVLLEEGSLRVDGVASTMPCKVIVSRDEMRSLIRLFLNWRVIGFCARALFSRRVRATGA